MATSEDQVQNYAKMFPSLTHQTIRDVVSRPQQDPEKIIDELLNLSCLSEQSQHPQDSSSLHERGSDAARKPKKEQNLGNLNPL